MAASKGQKKWAARYHHTRDEAYSSEIMSTIEKWASEGWELVSVVPWTTETNGATLYFKRPASPDGGDPHG